MTNTAPSPADADFRPHTLAALGSLLLVAVLAFLVVLGVTAASAPTAPRADVTIATASAVEVKGEPVAPGVRVDLNYERTSVVACLMELGYRRVGSHLEVLRTDLDYCRARLA